MIASYLLSSTFVPVLSVWLLRNQQVAHHDPATVQSGWLARNFESLLAFTTSWRWAVVPAYFVVALLGTGLLGRLLGIEIFPQVDAGQFQFRLRAPDGTRIEQTEEMTREALDFIAKEVGPENVQISLGYVGVVPSSYPINSVYQWMGGPEESVMRVSLKHGVVRIEDLKKRLREKLPAHLREWARQKWLAEGESPEKVDTDGARSATVVRAGRHRQ